MSNFDAIVANIQTDFEKYDAAGQINKQRMYQDAVRALKRFGNDMAIIDHAFIDIVGGVADLPNNFYNLMLAYKCEPYGYKTNIEHHELVSSIFYRERVSNNASWSECDSCCEEVDENIIQEKIMLKTGEATFYYKEPQLLRLTKDISNRNFCAKTCSNLFEKNNTNEIKFQNESVYANFETGSIYMKYYGLPTDEEGNIDIPDSKNGHLLEYVELNLKRKLIERLIANNDAQGGLSSMYQVFAQQEQVALRNAANELKMAKLTPRTLKRRIQTLNRLEVLQYEINTPWL